MDKGKRPVCYDEEDEDPVQIDGEGKIDDGTVSLCLLGKLWTDRPYNVYGLMETMKKLWCPTKGMVCRDMGASLISFQFHSKRDMDRVLDMEPWHFNKQILVLNKISNDVQPSLMKFSRTPFWIRLYDVPMRGRNESTLRQIGGRFGEIVEIDSTTMRGMTRSIRMKVLLDLEKPMKRGTRIRVGSGEPCWIPATYERLPSFCYMCGMLGHIFKDCDRLIENEEAGYRINEEHLPFGEWMKASPMKLVQVTPSRVTESQGDSRRNLFKHIDPAMDREQKAGPVAESKALREESGQLQTLMKSMEKCEVGKKAQDYQNTQPTTQNSQNLESNVSNSSTLADAKKPNTSIHMPPQNQLLPKLPNPYPNYTNNIPYIPTEILKSMFGNQNNNSSHITPTLTPTLKNSHQSKTLNIPLTSPNPATTMKPHETKPKPTHILQHLPVIKPQKTELKHTHTLQQPPIIKPPIMERLTTKPGAHIKTEPPSPNKEASQATTGTSDKAGKWKRHQGNAQRNKSEGGVMEKNAKRKEDHMEIDRADNGISKKPKSVNEDISISTAAAAGQPRRTL